MRFPFDVDDTGLPHGDAGSDKAGPTERVPADIHHGKTYPTFFPLVSSRIVPLAIISQICSSIRLERNIRLVTPAQHDEPMPAVDLPFVPRTPLPPASRIGNKTRLLRLAIGPVSFAGSIRKKTTQWLCHGLSTLLMIVFRTDATKAPGYLIPKKPRGRTLNKSWHIRCVFPREVWLRSFSGPFAQGRVADYRQCHSEVK
jgi:hypothetical protein